MSTELNIPGSSTPEVPASPTVTAFQQVADTFLKQIEAMSASFPDLQVQHPAMTRFIRKRQNVPTDFLSTVVAAVEQTPVLQGVTDPAAARNALQYIEAFKPVVS